MKVLIVGWVGGAVGTGVAVAGLTTVTCCSAWLVPPGPVATSLYSMTDGAPVQSCVLPRDGALSQMTRNWLLSVMRVTLPCTSHCNWTHWPTVTWAGAATNWAIVGALTFGRTVMAICRSSTLPSLRTTRR